MNLLLVPVGFGSEYLKSIQLNSSNTADSTIKLGRNESTTKLLNEHTANIEFLSRNHAEIVIQNNKVYVRPKSKHSGLVTKNGESCPNDSLTELTIGDTISLLGNISFFNFKLRENNINNNDNHSSNKKRKNMMNNDDDEIQLVGVKDDVGALNSTQELIVQDLTKTSPIPISSSSSSSSSSAQQDNNTNNNNNDNNNNSKAIQEHLECAICLNLLAFAHNISPRGDSFCYECITSWSSKSKKCPNCQEEFDINNIFPNRKLDNIVRELLETESKRKHHTNSSSSSSSNSSSSDNSNNNITNSGSLADLVEWEQRMEQGKTLKKISVEDKKSAAATTTSSSASNTARTGAAANNSNNHIFGNAHDYWTAQYDNDYVDDEFDAAMVAFHYANNQHANIPHVRIGGGRGGAAGRGGTGYTTGRGGGASTAAHRTTAARRSVLRNTPQPYVPPPPTPPPILPPPAAPAVTVPSTTAAATSYPPLRQPVPAVTPATTYPPTATVVIPVMRSTNISTAVPTVATTSAAAAATTTEFSLAAVRRARRVEILRLANATTLGNNNYGSSSGTGGRSSSNVVDLT